MQATLNSDNTVTITVNRNELAVLDYGLGQFVGNAGAGDNWDDILLANGLEQQLWAQYCALVDQIQAQSEYGSLEQREALWAHRQLCGE